jgi:transposase InsO family protein
MDDYSRYLVSWAMAHHQKPSLVIEALECGIAEYGEPREVLTDQGRQYAAWRGTTEFQELLRRRGIAHSKSRPQQPETLGKIERFWKTLWDEFVRKTVFADSRIVFGASSSSSSTATSSDRIRASMAASLPIVSSARHRRSARPSRRKSRPTHSGSRRRSLRRSPSISSVASATKTSASPPPAVHFASRSGMRLKQFR